MTSAPRPSVASFTAATKSAALRSMTTSAPRSAATLAFAGPARPGRIPELYGRAADPAGGGMDEQGLAHLEPGATMQAEPSGLVRDVERRRLGIVERGRRRQRLDRVHQRKFGQPAATGRA